MSLLSLKQLAMNPGTPAEELKDLARKNTVLSRLVASNPSASSILLEELSGSEDRLTRKSVANNPSTPERSLLELAYEFPGELLDNLVFEQLLLKDPGWIEEVPPFKLRDIVKKESCSSRVLRQASKVKDESVQLGILKNRNVHSDIIEELMSSGVTINVIRSAKWHINSRSNQSLTQHDAEEAFWHELEQRFYQARKIKYDVIKTINIPDNVKERIIFTLAGRADHIGLLIRRIIAVTPDTKPEILFCLACDPSRIVRLTALENSNCPKELVHHKKEIARFSKYHNQYIHKYTNIVDSKIEKWLNSDLVFFHYLVIHYPNWPYPRKVDTFN